MDPTSGGTGMPERSARAHRILAGAICVLAAIGPGPAPLAGQSVEDPSVSGLGLLLRRMDGVKRVLMVAAHPDDEDSSLLATLARGWGVETAYLSLTRGDGGQNLIGPELFEGLGVVRTGELEAARALDGAVQYFTRAFDYGFSKSADEALTFWPREEVLADIVWVIRTFRPQVVVSVWSGTPRDGHGQHQAAGILTREAFQAAGDPARFPEQIALGAEPWAPAKLYESARGFGGAGPQDAGVVSIETGELDPLLGRSFFQLSMESRSQHRSQDMGSPEPGGPRSTGVRLVESRVTGGEGGFFAGIDTTLAGLARTAASASASGAPTGEAVRAYRDALRRAEAQLGLDPFEVTDELLEALDALAALPEGSGGETEIASALARRRALAARAVMAAAGVTAEARTEDDLVVPGQTVRVRAALWNARGLTLREPEAALEVPEGWSYELVSTEGLTPDGSVAPGTLAAWTFDVDVPADAELSRLYYLRQPREGAMYRWPDEPELWALPRDPAPVHARFSFLPELEGERGPRVTASRPWRFVGVNPARGEFERPVLVVPAVSVLVEPEGIVWPASRSEPGALSVVVRAEREGGASGTVRVEAPQGWSVSPASLPFELAASGTQRTLTFEVRPAGAAREGEHVFTAVASDADGSAYREGFTLIDYEHVERAALFRPAEARVTVVPVAVAGNLRVGYVMGSGDDGPGAVAQLGARVDLLDEETVRAGGFDGYDVVVLGVRAYETRPDLRAAAGQLLDWVRRGGVVVAQYNRGPLGALAPLPLEVGRDAPRVADETAPVRILEPEAPVFTTPNRITDEDFEGWVQERGLYFGARWDPAWAELLELNDPGEPPRRGALLVAPVGEGLFVYTGLSFFRQWSARVPGAYRLFANLISLDPDAWRSYVAGH
ncbi:MAG TPA: PIG-L family deacetylase [Longimicrobiales bacterium]|nr:PIG-L family deacetylase [Longimicrobiales bacterium]